MLAIVISSDQVVVSSDLIVISSDRIAITVPKFEKISGDHKVIRMFNPVVIGS